MSPRALNLVRKLGLTPSFGPESQGSKGLVTLFGCRDWRRRATARRLPYAAKRCTARAWAFAPHVFIQVGSPSIPAAWQAYLAA